jgi:hypothetical protein
MNTQHSTPNAPVAKQTVFALDINLDDEQEARDFTLTHGACSGSGRRVARALGLSGKGSSRLAKSLLCYAWNKVTAIECRNRGDITTALKYEEICDTIYARDIQSTCVCW